MNITPIRQAALGDLVAWELRRLIITGRIPKGTLLVEGHLAAQFEVSRGPVRDAIRRLTVEGLVSAEGRSAEVLGLSADDVDELFSLRESLELMAMRLAQKNPDLLEAELNSALRDMEAAAAAGDSGAFNDADLRFHSSFYLAASHRRLFDVWTQHKPIIEMLLLTSTEAHPDLTAALGEHQKLANMILKGDLDAANAEIRFHLDTARLRLRNGKENSTEVENTSSNPR